MRKEHRFEFDRDYLSYDDIERIVRLARAERDAAIGRALRSGVLLVASGYGRLIRVIDEALRLRALARLDDRRLGALGVDRSDLPAFVYGWERTQPALVLRDIDNRPDRPDRIAA